MRLRVLALLSILLLAAACTAGGTRIATMDAPPPSAFQARLDQLGIPLTLPRGKAILVNIPHFELTAFENGTPVFRSRIIIGTPRTRTPRIDTYTTRVTFRPSWRPTPSMIASGEYADRVRPPGPNNPLGLAAVRLEPGLLVYLHDTNQRQLFEQDYRALSHGCIRVQRWDTLIAWLLDRDLDWVHRMAENPPSKEVPTPPVPVLIRYLPVFPAEDGTVRRAPDIYGLGDPPLRPAAASTANAPACPG